MAFTTYVRGWGGHVHAFLLDDGDGLILIDALYDTDAHRLHGPNLVKNPGVRSGRHLIGRSASPGRIVEK